MHRPFSILLAILLAPFFATVASAQGNEARASLYTRIEGERASAALVLRVTPGWYIYHTDLGHPDAIGTALELEFTGSGIQWGEFVFPEPHVKHVDDEILGTYSYNYHVGKVIAYATGTVEKGTEPEEVGLQLSGQTCTDLTGICVPYGEAVTSKGEGRDKEWTRWPESLGTRPEVSEKVITAEVIETELAPPVQSPTRALGPPTRLRAPEHVTGRMWARADEQAQTVRAVIELTVADGFHIYHGPTKDDLGHPEAIGLPTISVVEGGEAEWDTPKLPEPERYDQGMKASSGEGNIWINSHHGVVRLTVEGLLYETFVPADVLAELSGQVCDDNGCQAWSLSLQVDGEGPDEAFARVEVAETAYPGDQASPGPVSPASDPGGQKKGLPLWKFLLSAVGWGIFTLLMPCTYPMIPITISFFTKQADARDGNVLPLSLTYGVGIVSVFILIGLVFAPVIIPFATHPVTNVVIGVLFLFFSLVLFGWINLQPPQKLMEVAGKASATGGYLGVFLMGATLVVTSFTCTAPFVGTLLGSAATGEGLGQDALRIVMGMGVFGLTMATPFVFLSLVPGKIQKMPQAGEWMNTLKVFLGFVELAAALKFLSNADVVWEWGILGRDVFLAAWCVIFGAAGIYLIKKSLGSNGMRNKRLERGGALTLLLAAYFGYGVPGNALDEFVTTPLLPPYVVIDALSPDKAGHAIVKDDWDEALAKAIEQEKLVLVNFTGFT